MIFNLLIFLHVSVSGFLILFILMQHGKGADIGASFSSSSFGNVLSSSGSASFLKRSTYVLASVFFITSLCITYVETRSSDYSVIADEANTSKHIEDLPKNPMSAIIKIKK